jgi:Transposase
VRAALGGGGASGLGRGIAQLLVAAGEHVVDVPAKLAARARLLGTNSARKSDLADACSVAGAALHHRRLRPVALEDQTVILRLLSDRRDDLVAERTRIVSRLQVLLGDLQPGGANRELSASRAAALLRRVRPITVVDVERNRHRLNRGGNRQLNTALHLIAVCQIRDPKPRPGVLPTQAGGGQDSRGSPPEPHWTSIAATIHVELGCDCSVSV